MSIHKRFLLLCIAAFFLFGGVNRVYGAGVCVCYGYGGTRSESITEQNQCQDSTYATCSWTDTQAELPVPGPLGECVCNTPGGTVQTEVQENRCVTSQYSVCTWTQTHSEPPPMGWCECTHAVNGSSINQTIENDCNTVPMVQVCTWSTTSPYVQTSSTITAPVNNGPGYEPIAWSFPTDKINSLNKIGIAGTGTTQVQMLIGRLIKYAVGFLGTLALCLVIYSGLRFMLSQGDEGKQGEALKMMLWSGIGIVALLGSYSMVTFVLSILR